MQFRNLSVIAFGLAIVIFLAMNGFFTTSWLIYGVLPASLFLLAIVIFNLWPAWKARLKEDEEETNRIKDAIAKLPPKQIP